MAWPRAAWPARPARGIQPSQPGRYQFRSQDSIDERRPASAVCGSAQAAGKPDASGVDLRPEQGEDGGQHGDRTVHGAEDDRDAVEHLEAPGQTFPAMATAAVLPETTTVRPDVRDGVGAEPYISPKTAGVHVSSILRKFGVSGRVLAAALPERVGLLSTGPP
jgi:hypothetical protein